MGFIAPLAGVAGAGAGGGLGSIFSSILGTVLSSALAPSPPSPPAPAPPPEPPAPVEVEPTVEPEGVLDQEAAKARSIKRRQSAQVSGGSLLGLSNQDGVSVKTLLGE